MNAAVSQFQPSPEQLAKQLPDIGDSLSAACASLARDPQPDTCEILATRLQGIARHVMPLRYSLPSQNQISAGRLTPAP
jgi:hypothetical protein